MQGDDKTEMKKRCGKKYWLETFIHAQTSNPAKNNNISGRKKTVSFKKISKMKVIISKFQENFQNFQNASYH